MPVTNSTILSTQSSVANRHSREPMFICDRHPSVTQGLWPEAAEQVVKCICAVFGQTVGVGTTCIALSFCFQHMAPLSPMCGLYGHM